MLIVLKPAVLGVTAWKIEVKIFSLIVRGFKVDKLFLSNKNINIVPEIIKIAVTVNTSLVWRLNFFDLWKSIISLITPKPIPPVMIRSITVIFSKILPL